MTVKWRFKYHDKMLDNKKVLDTLMLATYLQGNIYNKEIKEQFSYNWPANQNLQLVKKEQLNRYLVMFTNRKPSCDISLFA